MHTIHKYALKDRSEYESGVYPLKVPRGSRFLRADIQHDVLCLWAEVHDDAPLVEIGVAVVGTGHDLGPLENVSKQFLNTVFQGPYVWHVWLTNSSYLAMMTPDNGAVRC